MSMKNRFINALLVWSILAALVVVPQVLNRLAAG